jgi:hypothetical protein
LYLFWIPLNANEFTEYTHHAEYLEKFCCSVKDSDSVQFVALDNLQLWDLWESDKLMIDHARLFKNRNCVKIDLRGESTDDR